jgi:hypothetical protein
MTEQQVVVLWVEGLIPFDRPISFKRPLEVFFCYLGISSNSQFKYDREILAYSLMFPPFTPCTLNQRDSVDNLVD